jgi:hypothetical protein
MTVDESPRFHGSLCFGDAVNVLAKEVAQDPTNYAEARAELFDRYGKHKKDNRDVELLESALAAQGVDPDELEIGDR